MIERITPTDSLSGVPYAIWPFLGPNPSKHHPWHPSRDAFFNTEDGEVLRLSLTHSVDTVPHYGNRRRKKKSGRQRGYHPNYLGPILPEPTRRAIFKPVFFAAAGAIPLNCIDVTEIEPVEREITKDELAVYQTPHPDRGYAYWSQAYLPVRGLFKRFLLDQSVWTDDPRLDQFVNDTNEERRQGIGLELVRTAAEMAVVDVEENFKILRAMGHLYPGGPADAVGVILNRLGKPEVQAASLDDYRQAIAA